MATTKAIETERLLLRQWKASDRQPFIELNADPEVMEYFPSPISESESDEFIQRVTAEIEDSGWGFWAVELKSSHDFIGFVGISSPRAKLPFSPCIEIGWRLAKKYWGKGYATEAAEAALKFAFANLPINEVVSFTSVQNKRSQVVMKNINMTDSGQNFMHPSIPVGNALQEHVLFKISRDECEQ